MSLRVGSNWGRPRIVFDWDPTGIVAPTTGAWGTIYKTLGRYEGGIISELTTTGPTGKDTATWQQSDRSEPPKIAVPKPTSTSPCKRACTED